MSDQSFERAIDDEVIVLESIYEGEISVKRNENGDIVSVEKTVLPATANNEETQYLKLLIKFEIPLEYPNEELDIVFLSSRGLSDGHLSNLKDILIEHVQQNLGENVLYNLIELATDNLTANNVPCSPCPICLCSFMKFDVFLKTECFHYVHAHCMYKYVVNVLEDLAEKQQEKNLSSHQRKFKPETPDKVPCPVCRLPVGYDLESLKKAPEPLDSKPVEIDMAALKKVVDKMSKRYEQQKKVGGLINQEEEKNKHLLSSIEKAYATSLATSHQSHDVNTSRDVTASHRHNVNRADSSTSDISKERGNSAKTNKSNYRHQQRRSNYKPQGQARRPNPQISSDSKNIQPVDGAKEPTFSARPNSGKQRFPFIAQRQRTPSNRPPSTVKVKSTDRYRDSEGFNAKRQAVATARNKKHTFPPQPVIATQRYFSL